MGESSFEHDCVGAAASRGFTLLELLVALAVAAILLGIAIPSYRSMVQRNAMAASVNDLVGALNYARSQAVTRGRAVYVCPSVDQSSCSPNSGWGVGWIIYAPDPGSDTPTSVNRVRVRGALDADVRISFNGNGNRVIFDANGFAILNAGTFIATAATSPQSTAVKLATTGRVATETTAAGS
ncbi:GspH/FimT family protein [Salinisphaera sp. T31B1]|uniref:GspH/FimT family pseudopilin n=1 Tax=Salinisphaera sp. T31B1 TaxID=727963 RepID=UPI0033404DA1